MCEGIATHTQKHAHMYVCPPTHACVPLASITDSSSLVETRAIISDRCQRGAEYSERGRGSDWSYTRGSSTGAPVEGYKPASAVRRCTYCTLKLHACTNMCDNVWPT